MRFSSSSGRGPVRVVVVLFIWLALAFAAGASGLLGRVPVPPPAIAFALTGLVLLVLGVVPAAREGLRGLGLRALVAFHLTRLAAGVYFLVLAEQGRLAVAFAVPAGWGDVAVGLAVFPVLWWCLPVRTPRQRFGLLLWNVVGLVDILGVLGNGLRLFLRDPAFAEPITRLPLALLPLFVVPLVIGTHILLFVWTPRVTASNVA